MPAEHPARAPAPWTLTGDAYWFFLPTPATLPEGTYAPLEASAFFADADAGAFHGKLGTAQVQVVRYKESPVGPYDELLYIPGTFDAPNGKAHLRITRIYVSSEESIYNGRKNWNVPKHLARFSFTPLQPNFPNSSPLRIQVFPPSPADARPFFSAIVTPSTWLPSFPLNTKYLPMDLVLAQPPLPSNGLDAYSEVGTEDWISLLPHMKGKANVVWVRPGNDGVKAGEYADGIGFPKIAPRSFSIFLQSFVLEFPEKKIVRDKTK